MRPPSTSTRALCALVLSLALLACEKRTPATPAAGDAAPSPAPTAAPPRAQDAAAPALAAPGVDLSTLSAPARTEVEQVLSDTFCHCGCPHSLGACLTEHPSCRHAKRTFLLAAAEAEAGTPGTEIALMLERYYLSFREARAKLTVDERMCLGPRLSPLTVVAFSDFQCPYCAAARPMLEGFARSQKDVRLCFLPYPLPGHPDAVPAAQVALLARERGKFWPVHDALFEHQDQLGPQGLAALAKGAGLDPEEVTAALESGRFLDELQAFKAQGRAAGVDGTPTVFVNGRRLWLPLSEVMLEHAAQDEREWQGNGSAWGAD